MSNLPVFVGLDYHTPLLCLLAITHFPVTIIAMKILLASDHRGQNVRVMILEYLRTLPEHTVVLIDEQLSEDADYTDAAAKVAQLVSSGEADRGILICGTGIGTCVVANKFPGVRAAPCHNEVVAELSRKHNNANVLCLCLHACRKSSS